MTRPDQKRLIRWLLAAVILAALGRILANDFVDWDDRALVYGNPNLNPPTWTGLDRHWNHPSDPSNQSMYDPMVYSLWWVLAHAGMKPAIFHGANLLVHWLSACVVLEILLQLRLSPWPAGIGAMLFAIHPLQTEAVAWATGMKDLLSGLLALGAIWQYLVATQGKGRWRNYFLASVLYVLALLSKPSAVVVPGLVWVLDVVIFGRSWKRSLLRMVPWLVLGAATIGIAIAIQKIHDIPPTPAWLRPLIAGDALTFYLYKLIVPVHLSFDYGRTPTAVLNDPHHPLYWTWLVPVALAAILWKSKKRMLIGAGLIFFVGLLPVLGLATFIYQIYSTVADRYVYVPMLGVAMGAAWVIERLGRARVYAASAAVLAILAAVCFAQAGVWKNTQTLFENGWAQSGNRFNPLHLDVLANYLDRRSVLEQARGDAAAAGADVQEAIRCFSRSIQLDPLFPRVYDDLCDDLVRAGRFDEAVDVGRSLIDVQPRLPAELRQKPAVLHYRLGMLYYRAGRWAEAGEQFQQSLQIEPTADGRKMLDAAVQMRNSSATTRPQ
jgi:hypothetical protein